MKKIGLVLLFLIFSTAISYGVTRNSYTKYSKHIMPTYYDPFFIENFANCTESSYIDWTGSYKYLIKGRENNRCKYITEYNPWLAHKKNEWYEYKLCMFNDIQMNELTNALREHSNQISSYVIGPYKMVGTKVEYLVYSYEYHGACKLLKKKVVPSL